MMTVPIPSAVMMISTTTGIPGEDPNGVELLLERYQRNMHANTITPTPYAIVEITICQGAGRREGESELQIQMDIQ